MFLDGNISLNVTQRGFFVSATSKLAHFYDKNNNKIARGCAIWKIGNLNIKTYLSPRNSHVTKFFFDNYFSFRILH
jgi:hypothetical protein